MTPAPNLAALRALCLAATPGPWESSTNLTASEGHKGWTLWGSDKFRVGTVNPRCDDNGDPGADAVANAAFIAAANPAVVLALLDRLAAAERVVEAANRQWADPQASGALYLSIKQALADYNKSAYDRAVAQQGEGT